VTPAVKISEEILAILKETSPDPARASRLAADYVAVCREVNARLEQIEQVLDNGDDRQALLMAERYPPVMDEADALCFLKSENWREYCRQQGLPTAPPIQVATVRGLNAVYAKGIKPGHGIYKEFRSAVLSKDDEAALRLARTIEKANPGDSQAAKERSRLEKKVWEQRTEHLGRTLQAGDPASIESALNKVVELQPLFADRPAPPTLAEAQEILRKWRAGEAQKSCAQWIQQAAGLRDAGTWQFVGELVARVDDAVGEHGLVFTSEVQSQLARCREFFLKEREEFLTQKEFEAAVTDLHRRTESIESESLAEGVTALPKLAESLTLLNRCWQKVESFSRPVDKELVQRVGKLVDFLRTEVARGQKRRMLVLATTSVVVVAFAATLGWWLVGLYRANDARAEIAAAMETRLVDGTEKLIGTAEDRGLTKFSSALERQFEEARSWIADQRSEFQQVENALVELEETAAQGFRNGDPHQQTGRMAKLEESMGALPTEHQGVLRQRYAQLRNTFDAWVGDVKQEVFASFRLEIAAFETEQFALLKQKQSLSSFTTALETAEKAMTDWTGKLRPEVSELQPPPDLRASAEAMQESVRGYREHLDRLEESFAAMRSATDIEKYQAAVVTAADSPLLQIEEVQMLRPITLLAPDPDQLMAQLVFPWKPEAWKTLLNGGESEKLYPDEITASENRHLADIFSEEFTRDIFVSQIQGPSARQVFVKGGNLERKERSSFDYGKGEIRQLVIWSGDVYDPKADGASIQFRRREFSPAEEKADDFASSANPQGKAASSIIYDAMRIRDMLDNINVRMSVWEILDRANAADVQCPVYLAYLAQKFDALMKIRGFAWGGHFTPSGMEFLKQLNFATSGKSMSSGDWLRESLQDPKMVEDIRSTLAQNTRFLQEARVNRMLALAAKQAGQLQYAGFIDANGEAVLAKTTRPVDALWGLAGAPPNQSAEMLFTLRAGEQQLETHFEPTAQALPFSPLFAFTGNRAQIVEQARESAMISTEVLESLQLSPLFLQPTPLGAESPESAEITADGSL